MVIKEDVVQWFKGLESYKRIDTMCTLLNMCLPFELRFLGTCLEELGGRDSKELRGIELRVNNPNELAQEMASAQLSDPSDIKVRRKMALYFALIRACNRPCVNELFNILCDWSNDDFLERAKGDALQELLLVFTMAAKHPVFSYEQRTKCGEIYNRILYGVTETVFGELPCDIKTVIETNPGHNAGQPNAIYPQKHMPSNEHVMCAPVFSIQNPTANVGPVSFDQNRGSQIVHREIVNISPHHIYTENVQPLYHQNVTHVCPSSASSNIAPFTVSRANQMNQSQPIQTIPNSQQQQQQQQHIRNVTNATNLTYSLQNLSVVDNNVVFLNSDGIPMRKSDSDSASSVEEDSTPPDTPQTSDPANSSMVGSSSNNSSCSISKKYKGFGDGGKQQRSRHKVATILKHHQPQQQHIVYSQMMTPIPVSAAIQTSDIVLTQHLEQHQHQHQQHQHQQQQSQSQQTQLSQTQPIQQPMNINSPSAIPAGYSIAANPSVIFQQYSPQSTHPIQKSQMNNTTYHYHTQHLPMSNRGSILGTTPNTTNSGPHTVPAGTYRMPTYHIQPNGDVIYPFPSTITYLPLTPRPSPSSTSNQTHTILPTPPITMQHLPTLTSLSSKTNQTAIISPYLLANENVKANTSCFNCGSSAHTGQECQEASMEDAAKHYKLDYNAQLVNDTVKSTVSDLDNGGSGVKQSETITHMPVLNK